MIVPIALIAGAGLLFYSQKADTPTIIKVQSMTEFDDLFKKWGAAFGVDWKWLKTFASVESSLGKHPRVARGLKVPSDVKGSASEDGLSWGLMQMTVVTARDYEPNATAEKLNNPDYTIKLAAQFISSLKRQFGGKLRDIAMAYNQGAGNQKKFLRMEMEGSLTKDNFPAARNYWKKYQENYKALFGALPV